MSEHLDLVGLVRGELTSTEAGEAGDHLAGCATCRDELGEVVVGHALLRRAVSTIGSSAVGPRVTLPPLAPLPSRSRRTAPRTVRAALVAAAAAVLVAGGVAGGVLAARSGDSPVPSATPTAPKTGPTSGPTTVLPAGVAIALDPVEGTGSGEVSMVPADPRHTVMTLRAHDLPRAAAGQYYYAWLLDPATNKMLPLGQVGPWGTATFELDDALLASYSAVDVSLETDDGDPEHSVTSVLRGSYTT